MSILFYDDSPVFGGHEVMTLLGLQALLRIHPGPVRFISSTDNSKLRENLASIAADHPHLALELVDYHSSRLEALRNLLKPARIRQLGARLKSLRPELVVAVQGNIEHSSLALLAARNSGIPSCSYIPVPHSNAEMGAKLGPLRDIFCSYLFRIPDSFITITEEMAKLLLKRGASAPIHLVYNGVDTVRFQPGDRDEACRELDLPSRKTLIGLVGRVEFRQKQQHLLVKAIASNTRLASSCHLVFAGDGPDSDKLRELLRQSGVSGTVLPWCDPSLLYRALHAVVIPSRYEGLPLVMLEALSSGITVLGSDRDGMKDLLPAECRFAPNDVGSLSSILMRFVGDGCPPPASSLVMRVRQTMSLESFGNDFAQQVLNLAGLAGGHSHLQNPRQRPHT